AVQCGVEKRICVEALFFFSSRRRHTRWPRDWSSDVCSSDLRRQALEPFEGLSPAVIPVIAEGIAAIRSHGPGILLAESNIHHVRSEERRGGKEWRSGGGANE